MTTSKTTSCLVDDFIFFRLILSMAALSCFLHKNPELRNNSHACKDNNDNSCIPKQQAMKEKWWKKDHAHDVCMYYFYKKIAQTSVGIKNSSYKQNINCWKF